MSAAAFIDCEPTGVCLGTNEDGHRFYRGVRVNALDVNRFDCVRVLLEVNV